MAQDIETRRKANREFMRKFRSENSERERLRASQRYYADHGAGKAYQRDYIKRRFFWNRSVALRGIGRATMRELASLWKSQRGRCALTGARLNHSAQLDHKFPRARGGDDSIGNLQWLSDRANLAKRDLTNEEFIYLCATVLDWTGEPAVSLSLPAPKSRLRHYARG